MAYYSLAMLTLATTLAEHDPVYDDMVVKFSEQSVMIMDALEDSGCYDPDDGFFYDRLTTPSGASVPDQGADLGRGDPRVAGHLGARGQSRQAGASPQAGGRAMAQQGRQKVMDWRIRGTGDDRRLLLSVVPPERLRRICTTLFDEQAFLSPHGLRSVSRKHTSPYRLPDLPDATIDYEPAESTTAMYGGNSNWRGPVWLPVNYLVIRALLQYEQFMGPEFTTEYPTGSGRQLSLGEIAGDLSDRIVSIWLPGPDGRRPVYGGVERMQTDPTWRDNLLFYEYFHGDNGAGLGAMHQTGWTAVVADLLIDPPRLGSHLIFADDGTPPDPTTRA